MANTKTRAEYESIKKRLGAWTYPNTPAGNTARLCDEYELAQNRYGLDVIDHGIDYAKDNLAAAREVYNQGFSKYSAFQRSQFAALADAEINTAAAEILRDSELIRPVSDGIVPIIAG